MVNHTREDHSNLHPSIYHLNEFVVSAYQSKIHHITGCKRMATAYWATRRNVYCLSDTQGAQQLPTGGWGDSCSRLPHWRR